MLNELESISTLRLQARPDNLSQNSNILGINHKSQTHASLQRKKKL